MMAMFQAFTLAVLAASAYAQCSDSSTKTIQNAGDATEIARCSTFSGSVAIQTDAPGPIALDGIKKIDGNLVINNNSAIKDFSGNNLEEITGTFQLDNAQVLSNVRFPKLTTVNTLRWNALPNLQTVGFDAQVTKSSEIDIQNTQLQSLDGINLKSIDKVTIANNRYINSIDMQLGNISNTLVLEANNPEVNVSFPNLIWAFNMTFRNCSSINLPSLEMLNGSLGLYGNVLTSFGAPNLTEVGGAIALVSNTELTNISFPELVEVKDNLQVANNTKLAEIDGFPKVKTIGGALDFNGNMSKIDLPALNDVKGAFNIQSTGDVQGTCDSSYQPLKDKGKIQGEFTCVGKVENPGGEGTKPTGGSSKKNGATSVFNVRGSAVLVGLVAALFL